MDPLVHQACALIEGWIGMTLSGAAPQRLREFLVRRARTLGFSDVSLYLRDLERSGIDAPEPRRLINLITNGLTAFWRDAPQLDALRLAMTDIAIVLSHTGIHGHCPVKRNYPDALMREIAATGGVIGIGSGGNYAQAAALALIDMDLPAEEIARRAMAIAADICVYTNQNITLEKLSIDPPLKR